MKNHLVKEDYKNYLYAMKNKNSLELFVGQFSSKQRPIVFLVQSIVSLNGTMLWLNEKSFSQKFSEMGIKEEKISAMIDTLEDCMQTTFTKKERRLRENPFDLIQMILTH